MKRPAVVGAVVGLLGVAALASRAPLSGSAGSHHTGTAGGAVQLVAPLWAAALVTAGATIALVWLAVYARLLTPARRRRNTVRTSLFALCLPVIAAAALLIVQELRHHSHKSPVALQAGADRRPRPAEPRRGPAVPFGLPSWEPLSVLALAGGGALLLLTRARRRPGPRSTTDDALGSAVGTAARLSLEELRADPDPRRAIIRAYGRMEDALAAAGMPRDPAEASREYLTRVLGAVSVSHAQIRSLTRLFEVARFSLRRIDPTMRDQALDALLAVRRALHQG